MSLPPPLSEFIFEQEHGPYRFNTPRVVDYGRCLELTIILKNGDRHTSTASLGFGNTAEQLVRYLKDHLIKWAKTHS